MDSELQPDAERPGSPHGAGTDTAPAGGGSRRRRWIRRAGEAAAMCALMLAAAEVAGVIFLRGIQGLDSDAIRREKATIYERLPTLQYVEERPDQPVLNRPRELHPFFGFVLQRDRPPGNNHGFWSKVDFPYVPADDELVVGVFGGSVAVQVAFTGASRNILERRFAELAARRGFKSARVLSLAESGWRQPQSFYAFIYYLSMVDVAVFLDGFNEVNQLSPRYWPERYPWPNMWRALSSGGVDPEELVLAGEISGLSRLAGRWTELLSGPILGRSAILHCVWREGAKRIMRALDARRERLDVLQATKSDYTSLLAATPEEAADRVDDYYDFYDRLSRLQWEIARSEGVAYFHFLQPSHLDLDSKPWSAEERSRQASDYEHRAKGISRHYDRLQAMTDRLASAGVPVHNLRYIFRDVPKTVYVDETVHLNGYGLSLLANAMMDRVERDFSNQPLRRSPGGP